MKITRIFAHRVEVRCRHVLGAVDPEVRAAEGGGDDDEDIGDFRGGR